MITPPTQDIPGSTRADRPGPTPPGPPISAVVLLAGEVRRTDLSRCAGRSRFDLPIRPGVSLGDCWFERVCTLRESLGAPGLSVILAANGVAPTPAVSPSWSGVELRMDAGDHRGSGGALRDLTAPLPPGARVLVAPGLAYPSDDLLPELELMLQPSADVVIHADGNNRPSGLFLVRCGALEGVPTKGYIDLKEQAMPQIAQRHDVRVVRSGRAQPAPLRTLDGYIRALRRANQAGAGAPEVSESWRCAFRLVEPGAQVHPGARLHDAIVLRGGRVGEGAVVVRSLVGPQGVVPAGGSVIDEFVGGLEASR